MEKPPMHPFPSPFQHKILAAFPNEGADWLRQLPGNEYAQSLDFEGRRYVLVRS